MKILFKLMKGSMLICINISNKYASDPVCLFVGIYS